MAKKKVIDLVTEELAPYLEKEGYILYHTEFVKEGRDWFLRVFIESRNIRTNGPVTSVPMIAKRGEPFLKDSWILDPMNRIYLEVRRPEWIVPC